MHKHISVIALIACTTLAHAEDRPTKQPSPSEIVWAAPDSEWVAIAPRDLLIMTLAPDTNGKPREVVIQLMPPPFSQGWIENIRTLASAHWWDGLSIYRSVDNWVVQWGDGEEGEEDRRHPAKPLPDRLNVVPESEYQNPRFYETDGGPSEWEGYELARRSSRDPYSDMTQLWSGFPIAGSHGAAWPTHCYGSVGVARNLSPDTGTGAELYAVIGHAPRQLDRNIAVVGRVIEGMAHLSVIPRGTGSYGVYETEAEHTPIISVRLGSEPGKFPPPRFEYLSTESESFARYAAVSANRNDEFYKVPAGGIDICNLKVPIRRIPSD